MVAQFRPRTDTNTPPQNLEIEEEILGGLMMDENAWGRLKSLDFELTPEAFYIQGHQIIFRAIQALARKGQPTDLMMVTTYLRDSNKLDKIGGTIKLSQLIDRTITAANIDRYAEVLIEKYTRRKLIEEAHNIIDIAYDTHSPLKYVCNAVERAIQPIVQPIVANKDSEDYAYGCVIDRVKEILLKEFHPGKRSWKLLKLSRETGVTIKSLEALFFAHMAAEQYEPLMTFEQLKEKYGKDAQKWIIQGLIPRGSLTELYAFPGDGKTLLSYDLLISAALGQPWNGFPVANKKIKVVIVQTDEAPTATIQTFVEKLQGRNVEIYFKTAWTIDQLFQLKEEVDAISPDLLMIDSLTSINRGSTKSENDSNYALNIYLIRQWMGETGMGGIIIHHSNKLGDSRGSTGIPGAFDQVINLRRHPEQRDAFDPRRHLEIVKSRFRCPMIYELDFEGETKSWKLTGRFGASLDFDGDTREKIQAFLDTSRGTAFSNREISELIGIEANTTRRTTRELYNERLIERVPGKRAAHYYIPDDGLDDGYQLKAKSKPLYIDRQNSPHDRAAPGGTNRIVCESADPGAIAPPPPRSPQDEEAIADAIASEPAPEADIEPSDRAIAKKVLDSEKKSLKISDHAIASPETPTPSDSECDRVSDHSRSHAIASQKCDRNLAKKFPCGSWVKASVPSGSRKEKYIGRIDNYSPAGQLLLAIGKNKGLAANPEWCEIIEVTCDRAGAILAPGDTVFYAGDDENFKRATDRGQLPLTIKRINSDRVAVNSKNWGSMLFERPGVEFVKARKS